jgi:hypothetical protein
MVIASVVFAGTSDNYPPYEVAPAISTYFADGDPNNTYYIATSGNDSTNDGSINSPWQTINGARTGGAGSAAAAGDLVYFRGGTYTATQNNTDWKVGYYYYDGDGTTDERVVFSAYPEETPVFNATGDSIYSISIRGDYVVLDSLSFGSGSLGVLGGANVVIQNCSFDGDPYDPPGDQINDGHLYIHDGAHYTTIRNNYFSTSNGHAIKSYSSSSMPTNLTIEYNRFYGGAVSYGLVAFKSAVADFTIRYNRFEAVTADCISIGSSYSGAHDGLLIYKNAFDNCNNSIFTKLQTSTTGELINLEIHDNLVMNASSGDRDFWEDDTGDGETQTETVAIGEVWNNALYDEVDMIDPESSSDFTNYPSFWNYNAYPSTAIRDTAENQNSLASSYWQGSAVVQAAHGVTRTGDAGDRFYTIESENGFVGVGRYGDNIGGFTFTTPATPTVTGVSLTGGSIN